MPKEKLLKYLYSKRSELQHLRFRDILLTRAVADIHRYTTDKEMKHVPLFSITPIHCIDRGTAIDKLQDRAGILTKHKQALIKIRKLNKQVLLNYLPSVSGIKVIKDSDGQLISFEGNGRIEALKMVFTRRDRIQVEVEEYLLRDYSKILRRVNRVRRRNFPGKKAMWSSIRVLNRRNTPK